MSTTPQSERVDGPERFAFGENWSRFLAVLTEERIEEAERGLTRMLQQSRLDGLSFLDIGSGSGLSSLAARRLGARVCSFDFDPRSVECTASLRDRFFPGDADWTVQRGSALEETFMRSLGSFDIVYSWGVLHHTGQMWRALDLATLPVAADGRLFVAIYNDQGRKSEFWHTVKRAYNRLPRPIRPLYAAAVMAPFEARQALRAVLAGTPGAWVRTWTRYQSRRGMSRWHDLVDWVGGLPFEVASVDGLTAFYQARGFQIMQVNPNGSLGCNELVFRRTRSDVDDTPGRPA